MLTTVPSLTCPSEAHSASVATNSTHLFIFTPRGWPMMKKSCIVWSMLSPAPSTRWENAHPGTHHWSTQAWPISQKYIVARWHWVYIKHYMQGGGYLTRFTWVLPILLFVRDMSKVTFRTTANSHWRSMFMSLRPLASWYTTGKVLPWLLINIQETLMTNSHLNGSKPCKQSASSGRVTLSC